MGVATMRCGKCAACLRVEEVKQQSLKALTQAQTNGQHIGEDVRLIWNRALQENPCTR